jgi:uncharacterized protein (DUF2141 family)
MFSILVIADDLTGAAEIAGIVLQSGLTAEVYNSLSEEDNFKSDVIILNSNTRSLTLEDVKNKIITIVDAVDFSVFNCIYLKFDSVLRGHISAEIELYCNLLQHKIINFCPINPILNRSIKDSKYYIDEVLISQTSFAQDPDFPVMHDDVLEILNNPNWHLCKVGKDFGTKGVTIWEASSEQDLVVLAGETYLNRINAGASAYFKELLKLLLINNKIKINPINSEDFISSVDKSIITENTKLYVCGSTHQNSRKWLQARPEEFVIYWDGINNNVVSYLIEKLKTHRTAILAFIDDVNEKANVLRFNMAKVVADLYSQSEIHELNIEGGATAYEILKVLNIHKMRPVNVFQAGVIRMKVDNIELYITLKPGSYSWNSHQDV